MTDNAVAQELMKLENQYWQAIVDRDIDTALSLTDDPCLVAGAQGVAMIDKKSFTGIMKNAKYQVKTFKLEDPKARMIGKDVAILAYKVHEELTVDGKAVTIDCSDASTWVRRDGKWVCALHTESLAGDPYGRERATQ